MIDKLQVLNSAPALGAAAPTAVSATGDETTGITGAFGAIMEKVMGVETLVKDGAKDTAGLNQLINQLNIALPVDGATLQDESKATAGLAQFLDQLNEALPVDGTTLPVIPLVPQPLQAAVADKTAVAEALTSEADAPPAAAATRVVDLLRGSLGMLDKPATRTAPQTALPLDTRNAAVNDVGGKFNFVKVLSTEIMAAPVVVSDSDTLNIVQVSTSSATPVLNALTGNAIPQMNSANAALPAPLATPVQQPQWGDDLGNRVVWMVKQDIKAADIRLNPAHLGPLEVKISMQQDQVSVSFSSNHATVREALDAAMPRLREMLTDNGLQLTNANISNRSAADHQQSGSHHYAGGSQTPGIGEEDGLAATEGASRDAVPLSGNYLVDYYA